jgi:hypothetical protein
MDIAIPTPSLLNEFNRVLISLEELSEKNSPCLIQSLINHCTSLTFAGQILNYEVIVNHCNDYKIIQIKNNEVSISSLGHRLLTGNREKYYEITEAQKVFIAEKIVFKGVLINFARDFFHFFEPNFETGTYQYSIIENPIPLKYQPTVHLFKFLNIIVESNNYLIVKRDYVEAVYQITADGKALSEQRLEQILMENRKLGSQGELYVVSFEKRRLQAMGKIVQADLVRRISTINTAAGYDIESFTGDSDTLEPDRLIEVKASHASELKFYWSSNEKVVASQNPHKYWIYFLGDFNGDSYIDLKPIMIKNPFNTIFEQNCFSIEAKNFLITECANNVAQYIDVGGVAWYEYNY